MPASEPLTCDADATASGPDAREQRIDALLSEYSAFQAKPPAPSLVPLDGADDGP